MKYQGPKLWLLALILIAAVYLAFIIPLIILSIVTNEQLMISAIVFCSVLLIGLTLSEEYKNRQIKYLPITFSIVGIILILLGSVIWVPYTTRQTFRQDHSRDLSYSFFLLSPFDLSDTPAYQNGSLRQITLSVNNTKIYSHENWVFPNVSIIQVSVSTSNILIFQIAEIYSNGVVEAVFLNQTVNTGFLGNVGDFWREYFWTPPFPLSHLELIFENPYNSDVVFYFRVTEYFLKSTEDKLITNYRTLADPYFAYTGIFLNIAAITLYAYSYRKRKPPTSSFEKV